MRSPVRPPGEYSSARWKAARLGASPGSGMAPCIKSGSNEALCESADVVPKGGRIGDPGCARTQ